MKARKALLLAPAALLPLAFAAPASAADGTYTVTLNPLNNSGAHGTAVVTIDGTKVHVVIDASGLVPNSPHAQHLHGDTSGTTFKCPAPSDMKKLDKDGNGVVSTTEAGGFYGPVMIALTTQGDTSMNSALAVDRFPTADAKGNLHYDRTFTVTAEQAQALQHLHIVQHGIDTNGDGKYDGDAKSDLDPSLPAEATDPADCGMLSTAQMTAMPAGGVNTGGAPSSPSELPLYIAGGAALTSAAGLAWLRRRTAAAQR
ncbi:MAG: CHRD domain-containing protein [Actinomycetales bacterium]